MSAERNAVALMLINAAPILLLPSGALDSVGLLLAYAVAAVVHCLLLVRQTRWPALLLAGISVLAVVLGSPAGQWSVIGTVGGVLVAAVLVIAQQLIGGSTSRRNELGRLVWHTAVVVGAALLIAHTADYATLVDAGWRPATVEGAWWTRVTSTATLILATLAQDLGIAPTAFAAFLLVPLKAAGEGLLAAASGERVSRARS